jgi:hypothetical protein
MTEPATDQGLATVPGAMSVQLKRILPSGLEITFEAAPAGWLKADGKPRKKDWRAYYLNRTPDVVPQARQRVPSVTTVLDAILPKDGLQPWYERGGIGGALEAIRRGLITPDTDNDTAVRIVRSNRLGADALRDEAKDRGLNIHRMLEEYMLFQQVPNPADHPEPHRPFIRGLVKWLIHLDPEPLEVELLVADPENGYAGRLDLLARVRVGGVPQLWLIDAKTQEKGSIYESAHVQTRLYARAEERFGEYDHIDNIRIVVVDGFGGFREMDCIADDDMAVRALEYHRRVKGVVAACAQVNRVVRKVNDEREAA